MPNRILDGRDKPIDRRGLHKPVVGIVVTALLALVGYHFSDHPLQDKLSTGIIAISFTVAVLVVAIFTEGWTWRAVGVLIGLSGAAATYWSLFLAFMGVLEVNQLVTRAIIRSSLDVGGMLLFLGILGWVLERKQGRKPMGFNWTDEREGDPCR